MTNQTHPYRELARRCLKRLGVEVSFSTPTSRRHETKGLLVSMLGPRAVGKTSLLAGMYDQLENVTRTAELQLSTEEARLAAELDDKVAQLQALFVTDDGFTPPSGELELDPRRGIRGTAAVTHFPFRLGRRGREGTIRLDFVDYPGGWIEREGPQAHLGWIVDLLRNSDVILVPVDAPALMEHEGRWNRQRNRPEFIDELVSRAFSDLDSPRLVIICPIRCERYMRTAAGRRQLLARTQDAYRRLLDHLADGAMRDLVAVVVTPVQTLGEVVLDRIMDDEYVPVFCKTRRDAQYAPVDTDQPLRYVVRFAIRAHLHERTSTRWGAIWNELFGRERYLVEASQRFAAGCHTTAPFLVLQGDMWLDPSRPGSGVP
jgi:hypothetical protein